MRHQTSTFILLKRHAELRMRVSEIMDRRLDNFVYSLSTERRLEAVLKYLLKPGDALMKLLYNVCTLRQARVSCDYVLCSYPALEARLSTDGRVAQSPKFKASVI